MPHLLTRNTPNTCIYRYYKIFGTLDYDLSLFVTHHGEGQYEIQGLAFVGNVPYRVLAEIPVFINSELKRIDKRFRRLIAVIEDKKLTAYKRVCRSRADLQSIGRTTLKYNGCKKSATIVEFCIT